MPHRSSEISTRCTTALPSLYIHAPGNAKFGRAPFFQTQNVLVEPHRGGEIPGPDIEMIEHTHAHGHARHSLFVRLFAALWCLDPSTNPGAGIHTKALPSAAQGVWCGSFRGRNCPTLPRKFGGRLSGRSPRQNYKVADMAKVAFLGLGVMGFPMAGHLVKKGGHEVTVYNRTAAKAKEWADKFGGKTRGHPEGRSRRPGLRDVLRRQ